MCPKPFLVVFKATCKWLWCSHACQGTYIKYRLGFGCREGQNTNACLRDHSFSTGKFPEWKITVPAEWFLLGWNTGSTGWRFVWPVVPPVISWGQCRLQATPGMHGESWTTMDDFWLDMSCAWTPMKDFVHPRWCRNLSIKTAAAKYMLH